MSAKRNVAAPAGIVTAERYEQIAADDPDARWELHDGHLRRRPDDQMTFAHADVIDRLHAQLVRQLDDTRFVVSSAHPQARRTSRWYFVPDLAVVPADYRLRGLRQQPPRLEVYDEPLPLVVEVWSPSTGDYDVDTKLPEYQFRGDLEIWRLQPYERTLTSWQRQPDGTYAELLHRAGFIEPVALSGVRVDIDALFRT